MKRISYPTLACTFALVASLGASVASATPVPNSAVLGPRIFNDCPSTILTPTNAYPALIEYNEVKNPNCTAGFANRHNWRFSTDGFNAMQLQNGDVFSYELDFTLSGPDQGEGGLEIAPWFSPDVGGQFQVRNFDGEIAAFGGVLPFYSFTANHGITYVAGTTIHMGIVYRPRDNAPPNVGQITYNIVYNSISYTSGPLNMDGCNQGERPIYGCYGILNFATVGGFAAHFIRDDRGPSGGSLDAKWGNIIFSTAPTAARVTSWGTLKTLYR